MPVTAPGPDFITDHFARSRDALNEAITSAAFMESCLSIAEACAKALRGGNKIMIAGNGGSAGDAQHIAGEFISRLNFDRPPLAAIALTVDTSVLTSAANDYGYEHVFERQILGLGRPGDIFIGISTSGRSRNIVLALEAANRADITCVSFGGLDGGAIAPLCDLTLAVPSRSTPLIQQIHITAAHAICGYVEDALFPDHR